MPTANKQKIGVILKPGEVTDFDSVVPNLVRWLGRRKCVCLFLEKEKSRLEQIFRGNIPKSIEFINLKNLHSQCRFIISLGGDGTLIGICRQVHKKSPPIFGVNMGRLGFITEFSKVEIFDGLQLALAGKLETTDLQAYSAEVYRNQKRIFSSHFINDAVLNKHDISRIFTLTVEAEDEPIYDLSGDGLIISSPIGSTAYSLAAGGPIIHPDVKAMVLTPICPHSLTHRPVVFDEKQTIKINITHMNAPVTITLDGQETFEAQAHDTVVVKKSSGLKVKLLRNPERTYFRTLKEKFTYGRRD